MSTSRLPSSETEAPQPSARRHRKLISRAMAILAILAILVQGCASSVSPAAFLLVSHGEKPETLGKIISQSASDLSIRPAQPEPPATLGPTSTSTRVVSDTPTSIPTPVPTAASLPTATATPTSTLTAIPQSGIEHVVIISVDGMSPDALELANTPTLDMLKARGAYRSNAQTVSLSKTLPSHASMLSGMVPEKHGICWSMPYIGAPPMNGPTLFSVAHDAGLSTAMVFGKEKLNYLILPNSVDQVFGADVGDTEVKNHAVEIIQAGLPNVLFAHFPDTDRVGHAYGWMSSFQLQSVTFADSMIGEIVTALESGGYLNSTLLIVTADHGGHSQSHGDDSPVDRTIPWLAVGPGVPQGVNLTSNINTYDTAATALYALKLPIPEVWDGQPVLEIFQESP